MLLVAAVLAYGLLFHNRVRGIGYPGADMQGPVLAAYAAYAEFLRITSVLLALALGAGAGRRGHRGGEMAHGFAAVIAGVILTAFAYALLPRLYWPFGGGDDFAAWLVWLATAPCPCVGAWLAVVAFSRLWKGQPPA